MRTKKQVSGPFRGRIYGGIFHMQKLRVLAGENGLRFFAFQITYAARADHVYAPDPGTGLLKILEPFGIVPT